MDIRKKIVQISQLHSKHGKMHAKFQNRQKKDTQDPNLDKTFDIAL